MRRLVRIVGIVAATLTIVAATLVATTGTAEASHCPVSLSTTSTTVTSTLASTAPPDCIQVAVAVCTGDVVFGTISFPPFLTSTATCPASQTVVFGGFLAS